MIRVIKQAIEASQPVRRGMLPGVIGVTALAALGCMSVAHAEIETDFGVDYRATGFYVESESFAVEPPRASNGDRLDDQTKAKDTDTGFAHYLRLKANFKHKETGVVANTRIELAGDRWSGDQRGYNARGRGFNTDNRGDNVRVDLAFLQIPMKYGLLRVGRQESNWNNCFLVCDDRRDRVIFLTRFGNVSAFIGYDRRQDTAGFYSADDGNQIFPGMVAQLSENWSLGFLYVHWLNNYDGNLVDTDPAIIDTNNDGIPDSAAPGSVGARNTYVLSNTNLISPYVQGKVGPVDVSFGGNWLDNGNVKANQTPEQGDYFTNDAWSGYFRLGAELGMFELKAQYVGAYDGGLISTGFDTYSSLINSSPESTANPTSLYQMGRDLGRDGFDQTLAIGSVAVNVTPKFALRGAVGFLDIDTANNGSDSSTVYDVQASYQLNEAVRTWATLGMLKENDVGALAGNSLVGTPPNGGSFAQDRVIAGAVYLGVEF